MIKRIYQKIITTEPVIYLDIFKGIVLLGGATGFFVIDDARYQAISAALGLLLPTLLTWLTRSSVISQQSYQKAIENPVHDELPQNIKEFSAIKQN
jgi:hypothetical protein